MTPSRRITLGFRPFLWLLADAAIVAAIAWPAAALLLFLVNPELPFTPAGFLATMLAILPQALLVFVVAGPLLVLLGMALSVGRTTRRGISARYLLRFALLDLILLLLASYDQWRVTATLLPEPARAALAVTVGTFSVAGLVALALIVVDARRPGAVRPSWLAALALGTIVSLALAGDLRRVRIPRAVPLEIRGFAVQRPVLLFEVPGMSLAELEGLAQRGATPSLESLFRSGVVLAVEPTSVPDPLSQHASLVTGRRPEEHRILGSVRFRPRGSDRLSFGILPRGLLFWPSLALGLWEQEPVTHDSLRALPLAGIARGLGLAVAIVGDPLGTPPPNEFSVLVPRAALRRGARIDLGDAGGVTCEELAPLGERFFDPPAAELPTTARFELEVREALEADRCALEAGRLAASTRRFAIVHVRLGGLDRVLRQFAGWRPEAPARGAAERELEAYGRVVARYARELDPAGGALASAGPEDALVALVSPYGYHPRDDLGRLLEALGGVTGATATIRGAPPGALLLAGEGVAAGERGAFTTPLVSVLPTLLWGAGLPAAADMGPVAFEAFTPEFVAAHPLVTVPSYGRKR